MKIKGQTITVYSANKENLKEYFLKTVVSDINNPIFVKDVQKNADIDWQYIIYFNDIPIAAANNRFIVLTEGVIHNDPIKNWKDYTIDELSVKEQKEYLKKIDGNDLFDLVESLRIAHEIRGMRKCLSC